ncbi:MAG TPA: V-type ATPase subunit, partial [Candidatus Krumholzibacterium sp.]|nr:V-type ATPase subunit [Candidatus Krumholzibacterium sp.]
MAQDYTYIVARLRALEASMPDEAWFQRIARTPAESLLAAIREFYRGFDTVDSLYDFEDGLEAGRKELLDLLGSLISDPDATLFLRAGYDLDNLIHAYKAGSMGAPASMNGFGLVDPEVIGRAVTGVSTVDLPGYMKEFMDRLAALGDPADPGLVEYEGEALKWAFLYSVAPGRVAREYLSTKIGLTNIRMFIRLKRSPLRKQVPGSVWIEGGEIDRPTLATLFREPEDELHSYLAYTSDRGLAAMGLGTATPLWKVEAILDRQLLARIGESSYRFFDMGPVLYHIELREKNEHLLRLLLTGKLNRLPDERILEGVEAMTA